MRRAPAIDSRRGGRRLCAAVAAFAIVALIGAAAPAHALESDATYEHGPRTPFNAFGGMEAATATTPGLPATAPDGGLYVIGDSISGGVPYEKRGASMGARVQVRSWAGWTVRLHRQVTSWTGATHASFDDAARGSWGAVFVELGSNDVRCLHGGPYCADGVLEPVRLAAEQARIETEVRAAAATLLDGGKCVLWTEPRPGPGMDAGDVADFDAILTDLATQNPDRFFTAPYDEWTRTDPALVDDFARPESDGIHPGTDAGRTAIADLAVASSQSACGFAARASLVPPDPDSVPAPAPAPAPQLTPVPATPTSPPVLASPRPATKPCAGLTGPSGTSCLRARAVRACAKRPACMLRVRRVYGPSATERSALRKCRRATCRSSVHRRFRAR